MQSKIAICYGTRPEYLKLKKIIELIDNKNKKVFFIEQHDDLISNNFYSKKINIKKNKKLRLNSIFSQILSKIDLSEFTSVLIQGDTATACAVAIAAFHQNKKIIYLEAGLRSYDLLNPFPEESYRQIISRISNINLCPTILSKKNLINEKISGKIYVVGNTVLDNILHLKKKSFYSNVVLVTLHRRENLPIIKNWFLTINNIAKKNKNLKFILPIHLNPEIKKNSQFLSHVKVINHLNHSKFLKFLVRAKFIITDSGGIQEEASYLNKKVIVCRKTTERPEGISSGHSVICSSPEKLNKIFYKVNKYYKINKNCPYGDGKSSARVIQILKREKIL
jgi:UDP-N-acetylglucosamine 2-epimerase (non-hydrolysing)